MTREEAIKILSKEQTDHHSFPTDIIGQAEFLGIGALKEIVHLHQSQVLREDELLPGETKD